MKKKKKGFTLVELIAVIVILAILALIGIPAYNSIRSKTLQKQYENLVVLIETTAEKYASANGVSLINVEELINEGLIETDDGKYIYDPRDKKILNCYLIEVTYDKGKYNAKYLDDASFAPGDDTVCDLDTARAFSGDVNIIIKDIATGRTDYAYNEWIKATSGLELSVDRTNMSGSEVIDKYKWLGGNGQTGNEEKIIVTSNSSLNTVFNLEVVTLNKLKYYATTAVKIDVMAPFIEDVEVSGGNDWSKGRVITVKASDKGGSGIAGYYTGEKSCLTENVSYVSSNKNSHTFNLNSADIFSGGDDKTYYVCVKDAVGNVAQYDKEIKLNIKDKTAPNCVWEGDSTDWTNNDRTITLKCKDDMSGCDPQYSEFSKTYSKTTKTDTLTYTIKDRGGNKTVCTKTVNVYVDKDKPNLPTLDNKSGGKWSKDDVLVIAKSSDANSGIAKWQYKYDSSKDWLDDPDGQYTYGGITYKRYDNENKTYNAKYSAERSENTYIRACDKAGNCSEAASTKINIDKTPPNKPTLDNKSGGNWSKNGFFVIATSNDTGSGIAKWQYKYDSVNSWMEEPAGNYTFLGTSYNRYENNNKKYNAAYSAERSESTYIRACDVAGNCSEAASTPINIDRTAPTAPTTMDFVYGNWTRYTQNTWAYDNVYAANSSSGYAPSGSTDSISGVSHYQISTDNSTWHNYSYNSSNSLYRMNTEGTHTRYFRAVDRAGNVSSSISRTAKLDLCVGKTGTTGSWSGCSASCGSGTQTRTTTYTGISGRSCGSTSESQNCFLKSCAPTVTITGNIDKWACNPNKCRTDNYKGACALNDAGTACIQTFDGKQGNVVAKVSYSKSSNTVTFTVTMRQGNMTWIGSNSTIQFNIKNSSGTIYTGTIKSSTDANWNYGSTHTKQFTYTFNTTGTYYIYITSNSVVTSFDNISLGTITIS